MSERTYISQNSLYSAAILGDAWGRALMHPHEREIRFRAAAAPFQPFTIVTASGERYRVPHTDHLIFFPVTDENGNALPEEERPSAFILATRGSHYRIVFFDAVSALDELAAMPNGQ